MQDWHLQDAIISFILIFIIAAVLYDLSLFSAFGILLSLLFHNDVFIPGFILLGKIDLYLWSLVENSQSSSLQLFLFPVLSSFWVQYKCFFPLLFSISLSLFYIFHLLISLCCTLGNFFCQMFQFIVWVCFTCYQTPRLSFLIPKNPCFLFLEILFYCYTDLSHHSWYSHCLPNFVVPYFISLNVSYLVILYSVYANFNI